MTAYRDMTARSSHHANEPLQSARIAHVLESTEPKPTDDRDHARRVFGLDRDRPHIHPVGGNLSHLRRALVDPIPSAPLVDRDRPHVARWRHHLFDELLAHRND